MGTDYTTHRELIVYAPNRHAVMPELESMQGLEAYVSRNDETGEAIDYDIDKANIKRNGLESLTVVLASPEEAAIIESMASLQVLANVQRGTPSADIEAALTAEHIATMDRVNPRVAIDGITPPLIWSRF